MSPGRHLKIDQQILTAVKLQREVAIELSATECHQQAETQRLEESHKVIEVDVLWPQPMLMFHCELCPADIFLPTTVVSMHCLR